MCKSEYKLTRKMQWDGDVLHMTDTMHDVLREAKEAAEDAMTGEVLSHFECDLSDFREYMHDKIKWEQKQWAAMPKWIPVTERFPEPVCVQTRRKTKPVLLYSPKGGFYVGWYFGKDYQGHHLFTNRTSKDSLQYITTKVTHWMPLPEPPKED